MDMNDQDESRNVEDVRGDTNRRRHLAKEGPWNGGAGVFHSRHQRTAGSWLKKGLESGDLNACDTFGS